MKNRDYLDGWRDGYRACLEGPPVKCRSRCRINGLACQKPKDHQGPHDSTTPAGTWLWWDNQGETT